MRAILERDFVHTASRVLSFRSRTYIGVIVGMAMLSSIYGNYGEFRSSPDYVATEAFGVGAAVLVLLLVVLTPPTVVGSVLAERQQSTLELVLASPVGPTGYALAKVLARTGVVLTWVVACLPVLAYTLVLGGVSRLAILELLVICAAVVLEITAWGVWVSSWSRRLATASVLTYLIPGVRWAGMFIAAVYRLRAVRLSNVASPDPEILLGLTPAGALMHLISPGDYAKIWPGSSLFASTSATSPVSTPLGPATWLFLLTAVLALLSALLSGRRLARESEPGRTGRRRSRSGSAARIPPPRGNPVAWKEGWLLDTAASRTLYWSSILVMAAVVLLYFLTHRPFDPGGDFAASFRPERMRMEEDAMRLFAWMGVGLCALSALTGAASLGQERTQGTWDLLRVSPLPAGQVVRGKLIGLLRGLAVLMVFPLTLVAVASHHSRAPDVGACFAAAVLIAVPLAFWAVVGMACGLRTVKPARATTIAILLFCLALVGIPLLSYLAKGLWYIMDWGGNVHEEIATAGPYSVVYGALRLVAWDDSLRHLRRLGFLAWTFVAAHGVAAGVLMWWMARWIRHGLEVVEARDDESVALSQESA